MAVNLRAVLSDRCNYRCVFCSRDFNSAVNMDMRPDFLETCIEIFASLEGVKIHYSRSRNGYFLEDTGEFMLWQ